MASVKILSKNLPYIGQQLFALLGNTSGSVKFVCGVIFFGYFLSYSDEAVKLLSVTPGLFVPPAFRIWTAFTYCFLEIHFWEVCVDLVTVGLCGKLVEPLWGQLEMIVFFSVVNLGVAVVTTSFYMLLFVCTSETDLLFKVHIHGLAGFIAALSVAVKQVMPDHVIVKTPLGKLTNRCVPLCLVCTSLVLYVLGLLEGTNPAMFTSGILVSWTYLRFYQHHTNGTRGDMADNFSFSSFFPNVLQPPISVVCNTIHYGLVKTGLCRKTVRKFDMSAAPSGVTITLPGNDPHDMERRRQIALKALSERLNEMRTKSGDGGSGHQSQSTRKEGGGGGGGSSAAGLSGAPLLVPPPPPPPLHSAVGLPLITSSSPSSSHHLHHHHHHHSHKGTHGHHHHQHQQQEVSGIVAPLPAAQPLLPVATGVLPVAAMAAPTNSVVVDVHANSVDT